MVKLTIKRHEQLSGRSAVETAVVVFPEHCDFEGGLWAEGVLTIAFLSFVDHPKKPPRPIQTEMTMNLFDARQRRMVRPLFSDSVIAEMKRRLRRNEVPYEIEVDAEAYRRLVEMARAHLNSKR